MGILLYHTQSHILSTTWGSYYTIPKAIFHLLKGDSMQKPFVLPVHLLVSPLDPAVLGVPLDPLQAVASKYRKGP